MGIFPLIFLASTILNFSRKLLSLLMLESCMLILVSDFFFSLGSGASISVICLTLMLFLVLDSVFGLSLLGNSTRFSSFYCPFRFVL